MNMLLINQSWNVKKEKLFQHQNKKYTLMLQSSCFWMEKKKIRTVTTEISLLKRIYIWDTSSETTKQASNILELSQRYTQRFTKLASAYVKAYPSWS